MKYIASTSLMSVLAEIASTVWENQPNRTPLGRPAVGMVVIFPAGLPQESRPGGANRVNQGESGVVPR
jgi:hypothetical protein